MAVLIAKMPMEKWSVSSKGLIGYENGVFTIHVESSGEQGDILYRWMVEICAYRLHVYFERKDLRIG